MKLEELKKLAEKAKLGRWGDGLSGDWRVDPKDSTCVETVEEHFIAECRTASASTNAAFIAAMNPTQALALIEAVETARGALEKTSRKPVAESPDLDMAIIDARTALTRIKELLG